MALKAVVDNLDGVDKTLHTLFEKGQDGKFYLQVEGMVPATRLTEFRDNNITLKKELEKFEDIDPVKYQDLLKKEKLINEGKLVDEGKINQVVEERTKAMREEHEKQLKKATDGLTTANTRLSSVLIDSNVKSSAVAAGVIPTAIDDVVLRAKSLFQVKDGQVVALNDKGDVMYGKDPTKPLTIDEWVTGLKTSAAHLFQGYVGSGARGGSGPGGDTSKMSSTDKITAGLAMGHGAGTPPKQ